MIPILSDIMPILLKAAPTIATALGSPASGIAIELLERAFGVESGNTSSLIDKINDPSAIGVLQDLDNAHSSLLTPIANLKLPSNLEVSFKVNWPSEK